MTHEQLPLPLDLPPALSRDDFIVGPGNRDALAVIEAWPGWPAPVVLLAGPPGSGKSHLAAIWQGVAGGRTIPAAALTMSSGEDLGRGDALAVEDIDRGSYEDAALFHLLNRARENGGSILLTARAGATGIGFELPDLASRLRAAHPLTLAAPDEALLAQLLVKLFADRQLTIPPPLVSYLVRRMERSFAAANALVRSLDQAALASGRPISRQLAAAVLRLESAENGGNEAD